MKNEIRFIWNTAVTVLDMRRMNSVEYTHKKGWTFDILETKVTKEYFYFSYLKKDSR